MAPQNIWLTNFMRHQGREAVVGHWSLVVSRWSLANNAGAKGFANDQRLLRGPAVAAPRFD